MTQPDTWRMIRRRAVAVGIMVHDAPGPISTKF
jgi:hypothetical protein